MASIGASISKSMAKEQCPASPACSRDNTTPQFAGRNTASSSPPGQWHAALMAALGVETAGSWNVTFTKPTPSSPKTITLPTLSEKIILMLGKLTRDELS